MRPAGQAFRSYWIWFVGSVVWWIDAALALHYDHRAHALLALGVAVLFFVAGIVWRGKWNRLQ